MSCVASAQLIVGVMSQLAARQSNLCLAALAGARSFQEWRHYPEHDAVDRQHATEFYYHAHAAKERLADEHGHFHVFSRSSRTNRFHHLAGISLNPLGMPTRLFLTNQWVTGESWVSAARIAPLVARFECQVSGRLAPVATWITAMIRVYAPEIMALHAQRQAWSMRGVDSVRERHARLHDQRHAVIAQKKLNLPRHLAALGAIAIPAR